MKTESGREARAMTTKFFVLLFSLILIGCQPKSQTQGSPVQPIASPAKSNPKVLVAFGDSLTEGLGVDVEQTYPAQLDRKLKAENLDWKVVNAGLSGETSSGAVSRLDWVLKLKPDAVLLETGANDGLRGIDPKITEDNLVALIKQLQSRDIAVMLAGMKTLSNLGPDYTEKFEAVYPRVAEQTGVPLIPFFLDGVAGIPGLNQKDRIHPTEEGYTLIVEKLTPVIVAWLSKVSVPSPTTSPNSP